MAHLCRVSALMLLASGVAGVHVTAFGAGKSQGFLAAGMRPEVVAQTLVSVEDEWAHMADSFIACRNSTEAEPCDATELNFLNSCGTVVKAMVQGSSGDSAAVREYMGAVCSKDSLEGWRQRQCQGLAESVDNAMSVDAYDNREELNTTDVCHKYFEKFTAAEKVIVAERVAEEQAKAAAEAAEQKKREEEEAEERKKAEEAEEKEKEEAAKEAKAQEAEEAKARAEAAQQKAEEAKKAAEEASQKLQAKKAEAEKTAEDAKLAVQNATAPKASLVGTNATAAAAEPHANVTDAADAALARANAALSSTH